jgi:molybdate transport system permease protein
MRRTPQAAGELPPALGRVPLALLLPAAVGTLVLVLPPVGLLLRTPWSSLWQQLTEPRVLDALRLSLVTASITAALCVVLGVPLAWVLARVEFPGRRLVRALVTVPLVLPPVVGGVALLAVFGRRDGLVGGPLYEATGWQLPFTTAAVVAAQTFVALPFLVISVEGALRSADTRFEEVSATLGASRWQTFRRVTLPLVLPGVASGTVLAWARALGEFGATTTFAGNTEGVTQTLPLLVYQVLQTDPEAAYALSVLLLGMSVAVLVLLRESWVSGSPWGAGSHGIPSGRASTGSLDPVAAAPR